MKHRWTIALALLVFVAGCERRHAEKTSELRIEPLPDTAELSAGRPLLTRIEPYRMSNGAVRIRGDIDFPDGVRVEVSIYPRNGDQLLGRVQVLTQGRHFETPPIIHEGAPLPPGRYRFEYRSLFTPAWQTDEVLARTHEGRSLRGPGVTRDRMGRAAFYLIEDRSL